HNMASARSQFNEDFSWTVDVAPRCAQETGSLITRSRQGLFIYGVHRVALMSRASLAENVNYRKAFSRLGSTEFVLEGIQRITSAGRGGYSFNTALSARAMAATRMDCRCTIEWFPRYLL